MDKLCIRTERLTIVTFTPDMAEEVSRISKDEANRAFVPDEVFETAEEALKTINYLIGCYGVDRKPQVYPVLLDGKNIGHVQAAPLKVGWEIGYHIAEEHVGRGYATEAVRAFLPVIMEKMGISSILGKCVAENTASRRVLEKCGFRLEYEGEGKSHGVVRQVCQFVYPAG